MTDWWLILIASIDFLRYNFVGKNVIYYSNPKGIDIYTPIYVCWDMMIEEYVYLFSRK